MTDEFCNCIEQLNEHFEAMGKCTPFIEAFLLFALAQHDHPIYTIEVPCKTPKGNYSKTKKTTMFMNFCPICGQRLPEVRTPDENGGIV